MALKLGNLSAAKATGKQQPGDDPLDGPLSKTAGQGKPVGGSELSVVLAAIRKSKGDKTVVRANHMPPIRRLPTGIFEFDFGTGGGFPRGGYSIVYGPESSCKSNIAMAAVAQCQRFDPPNCNKAIWVALEPFSPVWAAQWGVDIENLEVVQPAYGEEAVDLVDALVRAEDVGCLVVDSLAALVPSKEVQQSTEKYDMGTASLLTKRMVNKLMIAFGEERKRGHEPCVILINQTRFKLGVMFGDPETMPGGEAQKFLAMLRIRTYGKNVTDKQVNQYISKEVHCVVKKAKIPVRQIDWNMTLTMVENTGLRIGQSDSFNVVKGHLQSLDIIKKVPKGYTIDDITVQCPFCHGYPETPVCPMCEGTGQVLRVFPNIAAIQAEYKQSAAFSSLLQGFVIAAHQEMFLVEEKQDAAKESEGGIVIPVVPKEGNDEDIQVA
jgi:recombination protein RecA